MPQQLDVFPILKDGDVPSAHLQPDPQFGVAATKTTNVIVGVAPWKSFHFSDDLSIHNKTWKIASLRLRLHFPKEPN